MGPIRRKPTPGGPRKPDTGPGPCPDDVAGPKNGKRPPKGF